MDVTTNPALITSTDGNDTTLVIKCKVSNPREQMYAFITVVSGTFQFNVGASADDADCPTWTSSDTIPPIPIEPSPSGEKDLHFHAANSSEVFKLVIA